MYYVFKLIEKIIEKFKCETKKIYYKVKYGKRLKIGKNVHFRKGMIINIYNEGYLEIGDNCFFNNYCSINCHKKIIIGENNLFGENVKIYDHNHVFNNLSINKKNTFLSNSIAIGNNCWFGTNVVILSKCNIEDNCVVGAGTILNEKYKQNLIIKTKNENMINSIIFR